MFPSMSQIRWKSCCERVGFLIRPTILFCKFKISIKSLRFIQTMIEFLNTKLTDRQTKTQKVEHSIERCLTKICKRLHPAKNMEAIPHYVFTSVENCLTCIDACEDTDEFQNNQLYHKRLWWNNNMMKLVNIIDHIIVTSNLHWKWAQRSSTLPHWSGNNIKLIQYFDCIFLILFIERKMHCVVCTNKSIWNNLNSILNHNKCMRRWWKPEKARERSHFIIVRSVTTMYDSAFY